ncbi:MAG: hypothetical protein ACJ734_10395 [Gaiellaceae bacterium]
MIDSAADEWRDFWRGAYVAERSPGVVSVWSDETKPGLDAATEANATLQES